MKIDKEAALALANKILQNDSFSHEEGDKVIVKEIDDEKVYASVKTLKRGFGSMIIGSDLTYLWGSSAISYEKLLEEFNKGTRS